MRCRARRGPSHTAGAAARFVLTADLGEIKVREYTKAGERQHESRTGYRNEFNVSARIVDGPYRSEQRSSSRVEGDAYRAPSEPIERETLDRILAKVADGTLNPQTAAELIRALRTS